MKIDANIIMFNILQVIKWIFILGFLGAGGFFFYIFMQYKHKAKVWVISKKGYIINEKTDRLRLIKKEGGEFMKLFWHKALIKPIRVSELESKTIHLVKLDERTFVPVKPILSEGFYKLEPLEDDLRSWSLLTDNILHKDLVQEAWYKNPMVLSAGMLVVTLAFMYLLVSTLLDKASLLETYGEQIAGNSQALNNLAEAIKEIVRQKGTPVG